MKQKGKSECPQEARHTETTQDERVRIITLRDNIGWKWTKIVEQLNIDQRTCQKVRS